jgi:hypothetical protein
MVDKGVGLGRVGRFRATSADAGGRATPGAVAEQTAMPYAGRGLQPRPERFDVVAIFEPSNKPCGRGNIPRPAVVQ